MSSDERQVALLGVCWPRDSRGHVISMPYPERQRIAMAWRRTLRRRARRAGRVDRELMRAAAELGIDLAKRDGE